MSIYGIGTDLVAIHRIEAALQRHGERFAQRVLGLKEQAVWHARSQRSAVRGVRYLATRFAAKEAFSKAIGMGMRMPMAWRYCEVLNGPGGAPQVHLSGELAAWFASRKLRAHVSVTDEQDHAAAYVVVEEMPS